MMTRIEFLTRRWFEVDQLRYKKLAEIRSLTGDESWMRRRNIPATRYTLAASGSVCAECLLRDQTASCTQIRAEIEAEPGRGPLVNHHLAGMRVLPLSLEVGTQH